MTSPSPADLDNSNRQFLRNWLDSYARKLSDATDGGIVSHIVQALLTLLPNEEPPMTDNIDWFDLHQISSLTEADPRRYLSEETMAAVRECLEPLRGDQRTSHVIAPFRTKPGSMKQRPTLAERLPTDCNRYRSACSLASRALALLDGEKHE